MLPSQTVTLVFFGLVLAWLIALTVFFYRLMVHYQKLTKGITKKDLRTILEKLLKGQQQETEKIKHLLSEIEKVKKEEIFDIQKIGLVRYNPFAETGGDQSFCLALLNGENSGLVISSLHSRDTTRVYAKPIKKSKASGYELSDEEKQAVKKARKLK